MFDVGLGTLVTYNPTALTPDSSIGAVVRLLARDGIRHVPVVDAERRVVGIISSLDIERNCPLSPDAADVDPAHEASPVGCRLLVGELMKTPVLTVDHHESPAAVLNVLLKNRIHSVPVVENERLIGMVTATDFLRELSYGDDPLIREPVSRHMQDEITQVDLIDSLRTARKVMDEFEVDHLAAVTGGRPVGIIYRRDLVTAGGHDEAIEASKTVAQCYQANALTVSLTDKLGDAVHKMLDSRTKAVLVVDRAQRLRGLMSQDSVLRAISAALGTGAPSERQPAAAT